MVMTLHKLTAGDGYLYLVRQVAAGDNTQRGRSTLADYYSAKGEAPGRWMGRGLSALSDSGRSDVSTEARERIWCVKAGSDVREDQMRALYGEGVHPNADRIMNYLAGSGVSTQRAAAQLGRAFLVHNEEPEFTRRLAAAYRDHNVGAGAHWNATINAEIRAHIRTHLAEELFGVQYGRRPADDRELSGFIARNTRARTTAVAGYDLTFSPVKSVSALWAVASLEVANQIEAAHDAAVADVLEWLQDSAAFTRVGSGGVAQVDTEGLIAAAFTHRDSRDGDPDLHTHVAISNKVSHVDANGARRWLALDGQPLHRVTVAASEMYNTRLEAHVIARLGVRFRETSRGRGKRPVREIDGVPSALMSRWSSRRASIEARTADLAAQFQATHGREPTHVEIIDLAQQATLETRADKHEPRSLAQHRQTWRAQATELLGRNGLQRMLADTLAGPHRAERPPSIDDRWVLARAGELIATVAETRSTWQRHHVRAEALRIVRTHQLAHDVSLVERLTETALGEVFSVPHARIPDAELGEPVALRRRDGSSVYTRHGVEIYTSHETLAAERRILIAAGQHDGRCASAGDVELALADSASRGRALNTGQAALVTEMATCGRRVALALAPAGTGKTTAMAALAHAWHSSGGHVIGLAPTANSAIVLGDDLGAVTDTLDKYVWSTDSSASAAPPDWFARIGPNTLIVVDEAGKAATAGLDAMITDALSKGASVRLVGDDGQLSSISAGGVLRDIAEATGALSLSEVVRFRSPAEAAAGLALRDGDPAGIAFYLDAHRIHVGTDDTAADMAYQAWRGDLAAGADSLLLAPTNDVVNALNTRARSDRLATDLVSADSPNVVLADALEASVGDIIRTRKNARRIRLGRNDFVRNGYRYTITEILPGGAVRARHLRSGSIVTLAADYVGKHVTLGYAATIDSAQGLTAGSRKRRGTCHIVGSERLARQHLYVAMTRATNENHLYLSTAEADPHRLLSPKATHPETAVDVLTRILARDGAQISATTAARRAVDPAARLHAATEMLYDALGAAAENRLGASARNRLDALADSIIPALSECQAWPVLRRNLSVLALSGANPHDLLTTALAQGDVDDATDPAAVLDHRIDPAGTHSAGLGVFGWVPDVPAALRDDPQWGAYLARREQLVESLADDVRERARGWTKTTAPAWALPLIAVDATLTAEVAVFRAVVGVEDADTRLTGPRQYPIRARAVQLLLQKRAAAGIDRRSAETVRWNDLIDSVDPRLRTDSSWPQLADNLARVARTTPDLRQLIIAVARQKSLPDELPAAALWWRIVGALSPTTAAGTTPPQLRPDWITDLDEVFGTPLAETIIADPAWPALVAAVSAADPNTWTPRDLLHVAAEHLDEACPIPPGDYARLITDTIDSFTHRLGAEEIPLPDVPADDALLPPEHENTCDIDGYASRDDDFDAIPTHTFEYGAGPIEGLRFEDLSQTRPPRKLPITMKLFTSMREDYRTVSDELVILEAEIRAGSGPAVRAARDRLLHMRRRVDADRPYRDALANVIEQWTEADAAYDDMLLTIERARTRLHSLLTSPGSSELDIASAQADLAFHTDRLPDKPPGEPYQHLFAQASEARHKAAEGQLVTEQDIAIAGAEAQQADEVACDRLRNRRETLRKSISRTERDIASAFAVAKTAATETLEVLLQSARSEIGLLRTARYLDVKRTPLTIPESALAEHNPRIATRLNALATQPYRFSYTRADSTDPDTIAALRTLRIAANNSSRKVLWLSTTEDDAANARVSELADFATTIDHEDLAEQLWVAGSGAIVVIDNPAATNLDQLALTTDCIMRTRAGARVVLLDPADGNYGPSSAALRLLATTLPWASDLSELPPDAHRRAPTPAVTQAEQLGHTCLTEPWRQLLTEYGTSTRAMRTAHQLRLALRRNGHTHSRSKSDQSLELGFDD